MKIFESYKKIAKSMLLEYAWDRKFGEPLPTLDDVMREASQDDDDYVSIGWGKYKEKDSVDDPTAPTFKKDDSGAFVPAKGVDKEKPSKEPKGDEEKPKSKGLKPSDFERDFDDSEPEDKPFGGDTGKDADSETGKDYVSKFQGTDEPEDDEEAKAQAFKDMEDEFGDEDEDDMEEETIIINGKKYRPIKEKNNG